MTTRGRRSGIEDRWHKADGTPTAQFGQGSRWRARYVDDTGREHAKAFGRKIDGQKWLDGQTASVERGDHVAPRDSMTVAQWSDIWLAGYAGKRTNSVKSAKSAMLLICDEFGDMPLRAILPVTVQTWIAKLQREGGPAGNGYSANYVSQLHNRLSQLLGDAVHNKLLPSNPCSRRTSPGKGGQKPEFITTEQMWQLHDAMPTHLRVAVLLGAFAGLRAGEVCGLQVVDVNFMHGVVFPKIQYGGGPLKTEGSSVPIPVARSLANLLGASVREYGTEWIVTNGRGGQCSPRALQDAIVAARAKVPGLPSKFVFHDLRHHLASVLIVGGLDVKTVQATMRHADATTTLNTYAHLWPETDTRTRAVMGAVLDRLVANM